MRVGENLFLQAIVAAIVIDKDAWNSFLSFAINTMRAKEEVETETDQGRILPPLPPAIRLTLPSGAIPFFFFLSFLGLGTEWMDSILVHRVPN